MIEQVILNLVINARDAMPKGGSLAIRLGATDLGSEIVSRKPESRPGKFICLSVSDRGCGIPPQDLGRIFEPFFTTKEVGKGTGLGLATVYGIVKQHHGWIEVESQVNQGATFKVYFPQLEAESGPESALDESGSGTIRGGAETILVVEDEAPVRELVCEVLSAYGYEVVQAESGRKALELWKTCRERVHLVLTDLVMPDRVNGRELAEKLWVDRPELKVIFTSGYSAEAVGKDFVLQPGIHYLQKPYPPGTLAAKVRDCLDTPWPGACA